MSNWLGSIFNELFKKKIWITEEQYIEYKRLKKRVKELEDKNKTLKNDNQVLKETLFGGNVSE